MHRFEFSAVVAAVLLLSGWTDVRAAEPGLTHEKTTINGSTVMIDFSCSPRVSTPETPVAGRIEVTLEGDERGVWQPRELATYVGRPEWHSLTGDSPSGKWRCILHFRKEIQPARIRLQHKAPGGEDVGDPVDVEFRIAPRVVELRDSSGVPQTSLEVEAGSVATFYLRVLDVATNRFDPSFDGSYRLELSGPGAVGFEILGRPAATIRIVDGEAAFRVTSSRSASATIVGRDARLGDVADRVGSIRLEVLRRPES